MQIIIAHSARANMEIKSEESQKTTNYFHLHANEDVCTIATVRNLSPAHM